MAKNGAIALVQDNNTGAGIKEQNDSVASDNLNQEVLEGYVTLSIKKTYPLALAEVIVAANESALIVETEDAWQIKAPYIRVTRAEVEKSIGNKLTDNKWRILLMNRDSQFNEFSESVFTMGTAKQAPVEVERKEYSQLNVRIEKGLKEDMEKFRDLINLNQNDFVAEAVAEYIAQLQRELI